MHLSLLSPLHSQLPHTRLDRAPLWLMLPLALLCGLLLYTVWVLGQTLGPWEQRIQTLVLEQMFQVPDPLSDVSPLYVTFLTTLVSAWTSLNTFI